jgi:hypothetical protein
MGQGGAPGAPDPHEWVHGPGPFIASLCWAGIPYLSVLVRRCLAAWQEDWQQPRHRGPRPCRFCMGRYQPITPGMYLTETSGDRNGRLRWQSLFALTFSFPCQA